jgi:phosphoribosylaminoimidazole (AIR) synthetase
MYRTFNMGLGMIIAVPASAAADTVAALAAWQARPIGAIVPRAGGAPSRITGAPGAP